MQLSHGFSSPVSIDPVVLEEAVDWVMRFQSGEAGEDEHRLFERWLCTSEMHAAAWERAEELMQLFRKTPPEIGHATLRALDKRQRRRGLSILGVMMALMPLVEVMLRGESGSV